MDPLSIALGVAGLVTLSAQIHQVVTKYINSFKHAPREAQDLVDKLTALISVLEQLKRFVEEQNGSDDFTESSIICDTTERCTGSLKHLEAKFSDHVSGLNSKNKRLHRMVWPLRKEECQQTIDAFHQYLEVFNLSMSIDGW